MILPILFLLFYAAYTDIKTLEVPLWIFPSIIFLRSLSFISRNNHEQLIMGLICGTVLFFIFFLISILGQQLGGADCLIVAAIGYTMDFYGLYAVIIGLFLSIPYTAYMKVSHKEHVYPLVPFLLSGVIIILFLMMTHGDQIIWI